MKRVLLIVLVVTVFVPSAALAGTKTFSGSFKTGGTLSFQARVKNGTPTRITGLRWKHLPLDCKVAPKRGGGTVSYNGGFGFAVTVARRHFETRGQTPDHKVRSKIDGDFINHGKKAKGYLKIDGAFPDGGFKGCHSGKSHFTVK